MIIRTNRLTLRPFVKTDMEWYYDIAQHPDVHKWLSSLSSTDRDIIQRHIEIFSNGNDEDDFYYVITNKKNEVLGFIIAIRITRHTVDVSYFLKEEYRHKGYMHEALEALLSGIRDENPFYRFRMEIDKDNSASLNVVKRFDAEIVEKEKKYMCYM